MPRDGIPIDNSSTAVLLIAHGSRRPEANADLIRMAEMIRGRTNYLSVEIAYLELSSPTIPDGGRVCAALGAKRVLMLPYFLSAGMHVTDDLEGYRRQLSVAHPEVQFELCAPLGLHPLLVDVVLARLAEAAAAI